MYYFGSKKQPGILLCSPHNQIKAHISFFFFWEEELAVRKNSPNLANSF